MRSVRGSRRNSNDGRYAWIGHQLGSAFSVIDLHTRTLAAVIPAGSGANIFTELRTGPSAGQAITTARYDLRTGRPYRRSDHIGRPLRRGGPIR